MAKKKVLVSIIMPYFNKKIFFKKSFNSVLDQSFKNYEIIIIFDGGDKADLSFIKKEIKKKKNTKLIINKKNIGAGFSRNKGINDQTEDTLDDLIGYLLLLKMSL